MASTEAGMRRSAADNDGAEGCEARQPDLLSGDSLPSDFKPHDLSADEQGVATNTHDKHQSPFADPAPKTPRASSPVKTPGTSVELADEEEETNPEILHIMEQFEGSEDQPNAPESGSETGNLTEPKTFPPRRSSLEPDMEKASLKDQDENITGASNEATIKKSTENLPLRTSSLSQNVDPEKRGLHQVRSHTPSLNLPKELPPTPDPEPDLPFDFHRFLEQLRHRTADPVARYVRSFLTEFGKKSWSASEQVKFISDFLVFIANKMAQCEIWRSVSDAEFDNAREGMEKLVMNRLYSQTFSPAIPPSSTIPRPKGKRKNLDHLLGTGRRGQHQEDIERDDILSQKISIYNWVQEEHLDIQPVGANGRRLLSLAQQELLKIKGYRAPRDKVICILNSCKVIFGLLRNSKASDTSADAFVPLLILVVLRANPEHLVSNVQYILRFRNQEKLGGEAGYYLSSLTGAIQFIENLDRTTLTVSDKDFETRVEKAVSAIAERSPEISQVPKRQLSQANYVHVSEKSTLSQPEVVSQSSTAASSQQLDSKGNLQPSNTQKGSLEDTAVNGLLRTIQRPLSSLGKIFTEESIGGDNLQQNHGPPLQTPLRLSPALIQPPRNSDEVTREQGVQVATSAPPHDQRRKFEAEDAAARQASAEAAEAQRIQQTEHQNVVETLAGMFPNLDRDVIDDVVREKKGRVGLAVDACLALNM